MDDLVLIDGATILGRIVAWIWEFDQTERAIAVFVLLVFTLVAAAVAKHLLNTER